MDEALLYEKLKDDKVRCHLCQHQCLILPEKRGICGVRQNQSGTLYTLVYGKSISEAVDPIEKKPFFHFLPGTSALSIATVGCNFRCDNCQNWQISQGSKSNQYIEGNILPPEKIIADALKYKCDSVAYTYTEPTIFFEYALATMKLAKKAGLKNVFVSNGYQSRECIDMATGLLDAINVDLKFFKDEDYQKYCGSHLTPILQNLKYFRKKGIWLEITTLTIPDLSDSREMFEKMAKFIYDELGEEVPWHISRFSAAVSYKLNDLKDTPLQTLEMAHEIGRKQGLKYVYLGNVSGHQAENTYCPKCATLAIERIGYRIIRRDKKGHCPKCRQDLNIILK